MLKQSTLTQTFETLEKQKFRTELKIGKQGLHFGCEHGRTHFRKKSDEITKNKRNKKCYLKKLIKEKNINVTCINGAILTQNQKKNIKQEESVYYN